MVEKIKMGDEEAKASFLVDILKKALGKDSEPKPYKKEVTSDDIKKAEATVKGIKEKVR